jgi:hypothetical protein
MSEQEKGEATEPTAAPAAIPQLTDAEKVNILLLQRSYLMAQNKKQAADHLFDATLNQLNAAYQQAMQQHPGHSLDEMTLDFQPTKPAEQ